MRYQGAGNQTDLMKAVAAKYRPVKKFAGAKKAVAAPAQKTEKKVAAKPDTKKVVSSDIHGQQAPAKKTEFRSPKVAKKKKGSKK
jgi:hypothetical protein